MLVTMKLPTYIYFAKLVMLMNVGNSHSYQQVTNTFFELPTYFSTI